LEPDMFGNEMTREVFRHKGKNRMEITTAWPVSGLIPFTYPCQEVKRDRASEIQTRTKFLFLPSMIVTHWPWPWCQTLLHM
jgi:hypothetical protein